ncbi:hypothetical protein M2436_000471 [Streptomyces sp. HB372]|nr:hypothetical protein [Streptomyces sp. HB372]
MGADVGQDHLGAQREGVGAALRGPVGPGALGRLHDLDAQLGEHAQLGPHPGARDMRLVLACRGEGEHPGRVAGRDGDHGAQPLPGGVQIPVRARPGRGTERAGQFGEPVADLTERTGLADVEDDHRDPLLQGLGRLGGQPVDMTAAVADGHHEVRPGAQQPLDVQGPRPHRRTRPRPAAGSRSSPCRGPVRRGRSRRSPPAVFRGPTGWPRPGHRPAPARASGTPSTADPGRRRTAIRSAPSRHTRPSAADCRSIRASSYTCTCPPPRRHTPPAREQTTVNRFRARRAAGVTEC